MAWKTVTRNAIDIKKQEGQEFIGTYRGKTEITTKIGPQVIYNFEVEDGDKFGVFGFTNLNYAMTNISEGDLVKLVYRGTKNVKTKFGLKDVHQVDVEVFETDEPSGMESSTPTGKDGLPF